MKTGSKQPEITLFRNEDKETVVLRIARLVKAGRKQAGLTQVDLSKKLELEQSALSRVESGKQILTAPQFFHFCKITGVSANAITSGYLEFNGSAILNSDPNSGDFKIPKKYQKFKGSKIRAMQPFIEFIQEKYGDNAFDELAEEMRFDPDYFLNLDNMVNYNFFIDLLTKILMKGDLNPKSLIQILQNVDKPFFHGWLKHLYEESHDSIELLEKLVGHASFYECNFQYGIANKTQKSLDISVKPHAHMAEFDYTSNKLFTDFICKYKRGYLKSFALFRGHASGNKAVSVEESECVFRGAPQCIFKVKA